MAYPPPFPNLPNQINQMMAPRMPPAGPPVGAQVPQPQFMGVPPQKFGFFSPQAAPPPMPPSMAPPHIVGMAGNIPIMLRLQRPPFNITRPKEPTSATSYLPKPVPVTTVFIGNITDKCHDSVVQEILAACGTVLNWKRLQDSNGKFKAFGFCDFVHPDGARRAVLALSKYPLGDKRLNVKVDEATEKLITEYANKPKPGQPAFQASGEAAKQAEEKEIASLKAHFLTIIDTQAPELLQLKVDEEEAAAAAAEEEKTKEESAGKSPTEGAKTPSKRKRSRSTSSSRRRHAKSRSKKRHRSTSSASSASSTSTASSVGTRTSSRRSNKQPDGKDHKKSSKSRRRRSPSSEDSDVVAEKRRLKRELKEREESYAKRLKKWEERERRQAKHYGKEEEREGQKLKAIQKEAKKLKQFLEDYQDARDDQKYYKGSSLHDRRRNYEREREADAKDRQDERKELEEMKKMLLKEKQAKEAGKQIAEIKVIKREQGDEEAAWETVDGQTDNAAPASSTEEQQLQTAVAAPSTTTAMAASSSDIGAKESPTPKKIVTTLQQKTLQAPVNGLFEQDQEEEEVDTLHEIKKKIKPFEITREDRIHSLTPEERRKLIKDLIASIPTEREKLFGFAISWEFVDEPMMEQRLRPWVDKKIREYIGEEEQALVSFICDKIRDKTGPDQILRDLTMVLDDEAEVFVVKLWRLIMYESEAKRLGLNVLPGNE